MRIIVPMAGKGKRMRPHTLTIPKPLIPVAGKPIVQHLVEDLAALASEKVEEVVFITGRFGKEVESQLIEIAEGLGATGKIEYQNEALGTAHAVYCAYSALKGKVIIAFADTLFRASLELNPDADGVIWVKEIQDPRAFGVVEVNKENTILAYHEKPTEPISNLAMIGIYYFKNGEELKDEIEYLLKNKIRNGNEYQLPDAMRRMTEKGKILQPGKVEEWLDCGNKNATVETNARVLEFKEIRSTTNKYYSENSVVIEPCFIGEGVSIVNSVIGPKVSIGKGAKVVDSRLSNCLLQENVVVENACLTNTMIGENAIVQQKPQILSLSAYSQIE